MIGQKIIYPILYTLKKEDRPVKRFLPARYLRLNRALRVIGFEMKIFTMPELLNTYCQMMVR